MFMSDHVVQPELRINAKDHSKYRANRGNDDTINESFERFNKAE